MEKTQRMKLNEELKLIEIHNNFKRECEIIGYKNKMKTVKDTLIKTLSYNMWIILYDLINKSYYQISNDIRVGKITRNDVKNVIQQANSIYNVFDSELILSLI